MDKPQKPTNLLPSSFGGEKENFSTDRIENGYEPDVPQIVEGENLNYLINSIGENFEYNNKISDFVVGLPIGNTIGVDSNNKLIYTDTIANSTHATNADTAINATTATKAIQDGNGDVIADTYLKTGSLDSTYAKVGMENLSDIGNDFINQSKALCTGEISDNPIVYKDVQKAYHSSFDISKFTVVGSPTITDDGIASGFNANNIIKTGYTIDFENAETWEICGTINIAKSSNITAGTLLTTWNGYKISTGENSNVDGFILGFNSSLSTDYYCARLWASSAIGSWDISAATNTDLVLKFNTKYFYKFKFTGTQYLFSYSEDNINFSDIVLANSSAKIKVNTNNNNSINIGYTPMSSFYALLNAETDLKEFFIKENKARAFSGNKTTLDIIKLGDYTVFGNPVISADGVASGFGNTSYMQKNQTFDLSKPWVIEGSVTTGEDVTTEQFFLSSEDRSFPFAIAIHNNNRFIFYCPATANNTTTSHYAFFGPTIQAKTKYYYKLVYNPGKPLEAFCGTNKTNMQKWVWSFLLDPGTINYIKIGVTRINSSPLLGQIDLNELKIYIGGKLVYQPCLKIPYTLTHGGAKIADMQYLDRVQDTYEQGFTEYSYFTINEENKSFTLPQGMSLYEGKGVYNGLKLISPLTPVISLNSREYDSANKSAEQYYGIIDFVDKNNVQTGRVDNWNYTPTSITMRMSVYNPVSNARGDLCIFADDSGEKYATVPTPASRTDKSCKVATTEWVQYFSQPNFSSPVEIPYNTDYTCESNGWWLCGAVLRSSSLNAIIGKIKVQGIVNGNALYNNYLEVNSTYADGIAQETKQMFRVFAGDVIKLNTVSTSGSASVSSYTNIFYSDVN